MIYYSKKLSDEISIAVQSFGLSEDCEMPLLHRITKKSSLWILVYSVYNISISSLASQIVEIVQCHFELGWVKKY